MILCIKEGTQRLTKINKHFFFCFYLYILILISCLGAGEMVGRMTE